MATNIVDKWYSKDDIIEHKKSLPHYIQYLWKNSCEIGFDIVIILGGDNSRHKAHKYVLSCHSKLIGLLNQSELGGLRASPTPMTKPSKWIENINDKKNEITITKLSGLSGGTFKLLLKFMYTLETEEFNESNATSVWAAAEVFNMPHLQKFLVEKFGSKIGEKGLEMLSSETGGVSHAPEPVGIANTATVPTITQTAAPLPTDVSLSSQVPSSTVPSVSKEPTADTPKVEEIKPKSPPPPVTEKPKSPAPPAQDSVIYEADKSSTKESRASTGKPPQSPKSNDSPTKPKGDSPAAGEDASAAKSEDASVGGDQSSTAIISPEPTKSRTSTKSSDASTKKGGAKKGGKKGSVSGKGAKEKKGKSPEPGKKSDSKSDSKSSKSEGKKEGKGKKKK